MKAIAQCPCCYSMVRIEDDGSLAIVRIAKPEPGSEWRPRRGPRRSPAPVVHEPVPLPAPSSPSEIDVQALQVVERVAVEQGFSLAELRSTSRSARLVRARWAAMAAARSETEASLPQLGRILNRDHTTVLHGLRRVGVA
jgi:hypothetical protein